MLCKFGPSSPCAIYDESFGSVGTHCTDLWPALGADRTQCIFGPILNKQITLMKFNVLSDTSEMYLVVVVVEVKVIFKQYFKLSSVYVQYSSSLFLNMLLVEQETGGRSAYRLWSHS